MSCADIDPEADEDEELDEPAGLDDPEAAGLEDDEELLQAARPSAAIAARVSPEIRMGSLRYTGGPP
jgi:hypothetical protein